MSKSPLLLPLIFLAAMAFSETYETGMPAALSEKNLIHIPHTDTLRYETKCGKNVKLCLDLPGNIFIYQGNKAQTALTDEYLTRDSSCYIAYYIDEQDTESVRQGSALKDLLEKKLKSDQKRGKRIDSTFSDSKSWIIKGYMAKKDKYYITKSLLRAGKTYTMIIEYNGDKKVLYEKMILRIVNSIR